ncbi:MAG: transcription antitermination protein [Halolamina sp.]
MDGQTFLDELRDEHETELSRLGSSKAVYALTEGEMDGDAVRAGTARELHAIAPLLERWAETADGDAAERYADIAAFAADALDAEAGGVEGGEATHITAEALSDCGDGPARAAGLAAALLVLGKLAEQLVGFFVGDADRASADEFRDIRDDLQGYRDDAAALLDTLCQDDADWTAAEETADAVIEGAYDWYVDTLEAMGVEPKNVC